MVDCHFFLLGIVSVSANVTTFKTKVALKKLPCPEIPKVLLRCQFAFTLSHTWLTKWLDTSLYQWQLFSCIYKLIPSRKPSRISKICLVTSLNIDIFQNKIQKPFDASIHATCFNTINFNFNPKHQFLCIWQNSFQ